MNPATRIFAAFAVGSVAALGVLTGCSAEHTETSYVREVRAVTPADQAASLTDNQVLIGGRMLCGIPGAMDTVKAGGGDIPPYAIEVAGITEGYCDILKTDAAPFSSEINATTAAEPAALPLEVPVAVGKPFAINYGGTENPLEVNITSVTRCGQNLVLGVRLVTGPTYSENDSWASSMGVEYIDKHGVTRTASEAYDSSCVDYDEGLPYSTERKPSRTYEGKVLLDLPAGQATTLQLDGSDGVTRTLDVTGK